MQVKNINSTPNFGTKCMIGELSAHSGLRNFDENITNGIYKALKKISKNKEKDMLVLSLGSNGKTPDTILNISYFNEASKFEGFIEYNLNKIKLNSKRAITKLITKTYDVLTQKINSTDSIIEQPPVFDTKFKPTERNLSLINELTDDFGFDDSSLFY